MAATKRGPTWDEVCELTGPTDEFLCSLSANTYNLMFLSFVMKDYDTKQVIFEIGGDDALPDLDFGEHFDEDALRRIRYDFSVDVLRKPTLSTTLVFSNGQEPLENFRMVERHYFKGKLIKSYEFKFGFVIPNSTNTWESVYTMPTLPEELIADILASPYEVKSDSFYFAGDTLIMHNKAEYRYFDDSASARDAPASKDADDEPEEATVDEEGKTSDRPASKDDEDDEAERRAAAARRAAKDAED